MLHVIISMAARGTPALMPGNFASWHLKALKISKDISLKLDLSHLQKTGTTAIEKDVAEKNNPNTI